MSITSFKEHELIRRSFAGNRSVIITDGIVPYWKDFLEFCQKEDKEGALITECEWSPPGANPLKILGVTLVYPDSHAAEFTEWRENVCEVWAVVETEAVLNGAVLPVKESGWTTKQHENTQVELGFWIVEEENSPVTQKDLDWIGAQPHPHVVNQSERTRRVREAIDEHGIEAFFRRADGQYMQSSAPEFLPMSFVIQGLEPSLQEPFGEAIGRRVENLGHGVFFVALHDRKEDINEVSDYVLTSTQREDLNAVIVTQPTDIPGITRVRGDFRWDDPKAQEILTSLKTGQDANLPWGTGTFVEKKNWSDVWADEDGQEWYRMFGQLNP